MAATVVSIDELPTGNYGSTLSPVNNIALQVTDEQVQWGCHYLELLSKWHHYQRALSKTSRTLMTSLKVREQACILPPHTAECSNQLLQLGVLKACQQSVRFACECLEACFEQLQQALDSTAQNCHVSSCVQRPGLVHIVLPAAA